MAPTHGRISASRPSMILRTMCGSARWARVMPTRSTLPSRIACRADATSSTFEACSTVRPVCSRTMPAKSRCGTDAHAVDRDHLGQRRLVLDVAADDVDEVDQPRRLEVVAASRAPCVVSIPPSTVSSITIRMPTMKSDPTRSRIAVSTRRAESTPAVARRPTRRRGGWSAATGTGRTGARRPRARRRPSRPPACARRRRRTCR